MRDGGCRPFKAVRGKDRINKQDGFGKRVTPRAENQQPLEISISKGRGIWKFYQNPFYECLSSAIRAPNNQHLPNATSREQGERGGICDGFDCDFSISTELQKKEVSSSFAPVRLPCLKGRHCNKNALVWPSSKQQTLHKVMHTDLKTITILQPARLSQLSQSSHPSSLNQFAENQNSPWIHEGHINVDHCDGDSSVISSFQAALQRAYPHATELEMKKSLAHRDVKSLLLGDMETVLTRSANKDQKPNIMLVERLRAAVWPLTEELEKERNARMKLDEECRMLSMQLSDASKAAKEVERALEKEQESVQLIKEAWDKLATKLAETRAEIEVVKKQAEEELEEEWRMLQMSEAWREERMRMKLMEAHLEIERRCDALDELRSELESLLNSRCESCMDQGCCSMGRLLRAVEDTQMQVFAPIQLSDNSSTGYTLHSLCDPGLLPALSLYGNSIEAPQVKVEPNKQLAQRPLSPSKSDSGCSDEVHCSSVIPNCIDEEQWMNRTCSFRHCRKAG